MKGRKRTAPTVAIAMVLQEFEIRRKIGGAFRGQLFWRPTAQTCHLRFLISYVKSTFTQQTSHRQTGCVGMPLEQRSRKACLDKAPQQFEHGVMQLRLQLLLAWLAFAETCERTCVGVVHSCVTSRALARCARHAHSTATPPKNAAKAMPAGAALVP